MLRRESGRHQGYAKVVIPGSPAIRKKRTAMKDRYAKLVLLFCSVEKAQLIKTLERRDAEIAMLRSRVPKKRIFLTNDERERLLKLGEAMEKGVLQLVTIVSPRTYQRWKRQVSEGKKPTKKMGRKGTPESLREIVVRIAKENTWGYGNPCSYCLSLRWLRRASVGVV